MTSTHSSLLTLTWKMLPKAKQSLSPAVAKALETLHQSQLSPSSCLTRLTLSIRELQATALQFALAGADAVIISARGLPSLEDAKTSVQAAAPNCAVTSVAADVTDPASVYRLFDNLPRTPDVLVNNAGVYLSQDSIVNSDIEKWWADWVRIEPHEHFQVD